MSSGQKDHFCVTGYLRKKLNNVTYNLNLDTENELMSLITNNDKVANLVKMGIYR